MRGDISPAVRPGDQKGSPARGHLIYYRGLKKWLGGEPAPVKRSESHRPRLLGDYLPTSYVQPPKSQIQMQMNTQQAAPATPVMTPATTVAPTTPATALAPAAPATTPFVAILAKPEDFSDFHVCPFFPRKELLFRKDANARAAIGNRVVDPRSVASTIPR